MLHPPETPIALDPYGDAVRVSFLPRSRSMLSDPTRSRIRPLSKDFCSPRRRPSLLAAALLLLLPGAGAPLALPEAPAGGEARLLRFPALSRDAIAFVHAGDLWTVPRSGGLARQLTTDAGLEWMPRFSPDGKWIAFTGQYDGNRDVFVIPAEGGEPKRLTFWTDTGHPSERTGPNNLVLGWTPDGKRVLFRSRHQAWEDRSGRLYTVGLDASLPEALPVPEGGLAAFSPDGTKIVYNRIFRNFRTWKRYRGGMTQNLWIYDIPGNRLEKITENDNTSTDPMWVGDTIYFVSDREKTANLFAYDLASKATRRLTQHAEYDVRWASAGPDGIVYENAGWIYLHDIPSGKTAKVPIRVPSDLRAARTEFVSAEDRIREFALAPEGKRAVFVARGEVFTIPAEKGNTRNLTNASGSHERGAAWSPDGKWIAYLSDRTGEEEIWISPQDGKGPEQRLTTDGHCWRFGPAWSPDSRKIAFADKDQKLFVLDVASKKLTQADQAKYGEINWYVWSPDSRWVAYDKPDQQQFQQVYLYSLESGKPTRVTSEMHDSRQPVFDPEGKHLYFFSERDLNASLGNFDFSFVYGRTTRVYAVTLRKDLPSPFAPESDEVKPDGGKEEEKGKDAGKEKPAGKGKEEKKEEPKKEVEPLKIDLDGIEDRIAAFPMEAGNLGDLRANKKAVFYVAYPPFTLTGGPDGSAGELHAFDLEKRKDGVLLSGIDAYDLSPDGSKLIYAAGKQYGIVDAAPGTAKVGDGALKTDGMRMRLDHRAEWRQIFEEAWRLERDFFYVPNLHGVDWPGMKARYGALFPHVAHRSDLTYLIGEMIGELNAGHTYVGGGDAPSPRSVPIALLGCDYEVDAKTGLYRIARILQGQNWDEARRSPLTEPGVDVPAGSYLLKIDGVELKSPAVPGDLLQGKTGGTVTITVNSRPSFDGAREVTVRPLSDEEGLRYFDRIESNRKKVDQASGGKIGYLHIPNMGGDGLNEFVRQYYPQIRKQGLVVDVRNNGGGFVSQLIIERLRRVMAGLGNSRNSQYIDTYPAQVFYGPMVCLINHYSASDGDIFPFYFKHYGLGPLIGTRTWGGVVGIRGYSPLVDGGYVTRPEFGDYDLQGRWKIEGYGVEPDIEVDNRDDLVVQGRDPQLEKGIEYLLEEIRKNPKTLPLPPPPPVRN
jgi:tricorn protease